MVAEVPCSTSGVSKDRITRRLTKTDGIRYDVRLRIDGKPTIKTFRRRHDADAYLRQRLVDDMTGVAVAPKLAKVSFAEYSAQWMANGGTRGRLAPRKPGAADSFDDGRSGAAPINRPHGAISPRQKPANRVREFG